jgi:hypothetical protein
MTNLRAILQREQRAKNAFEVLKTTPGHSAARVKIQDAIGALTQKLARPVQRGTPECSWLEMAKLQIHAEAYLNLVNSRETQDAFALVIAELSRRAWMEFTGVPMEDWTMPADLAPFREFVAYWTAEGYKRLVALEAEKPTGKRKGYRTEVRAWMKRNGIKTIPEAGKVLAISDSTLKSIMSDEGNARYGEDTLKRVLGQIQQKRD